jgi:hypothetical protein
MYMFRNVASLRRGRCRSFYLGATFVAPQFQHEYIRAVMASSHYGLCVTALY